MFSLVRALPSPTSAGIDFPLFGWFIGISAQSDFSGACTPALWLSAFAGRPRSETDRGAPEISRISCMLFLSVRRFFDYAEPAGYSRLAQPVVLPSLYHYEVGALFKRFSKLNSPAHRYPCLRFGRRLATPSVRLGAKMDRFLLSCRTLAFPTTCRFIPAHNEKRSIRKLSCALGTGG